MNIKCQQSKLFNMSVRLLIIFYHKSMNPFIIGGLKSVGSHGPRPRVFLARRAPEPKKKIEIEKKTFLILSRRKKEEGKESTCLHSTLESSTKKMCKQILTNPL